MSAEIGRTKDAGWQIGVSRTVDHPIEQVWDFLTSAAGTAVWLGHGVRPNGPDRTMVRFHQDRLADSQERAQQREHWRAVMQSVVEALNDS
jgi:uncharacterized protein YndB with AHSA1/START domain